MCQKDTIWIKVSPYEGSLLNTAIDFHGKNDSTELKSTQICICANKLLSPRYRHSVEGFDNSVDFNTSLK